MVVPNRLFRNRDAGTIRQLLTTQTDLLSIIDFGSNGVPLTFDTRDFLQMTRKDGVQISLLDMRTLDTIEIT